METTSSSVPHTTTPREPREVSRLAYSILRLANRQTASSRKLEVVVSWLGWSVWGALVGREFREETVINLQPESKETSVMTTKDQHYFTKGRGIDTRDVVGLKKEREQLDVKKRKEPKIARKGKKLLQPVPLLRPALQKARKESALV